jgi:outer membrane autotransporter protein
MTAALLPWKSAHAAYIRVDNKSTKPPVTKNYTAGAGEDNVYWGNDHAIRVRYGVTANVNAPDGSNIATSIKDYSYGIDANFLNQGAAVYALQNGHVNLTAGKNNEVQGGFAGIITRWHSSTDLTAGEDNIVTSTTPERTARVGYLSRSVALGFAIYASSGNNGASYGTYAPEVYDPASVTLTAQNGSNILRSNNNGIYAEDYSSITLEAAKQNEIHSGAGKAIWAYTPRENLLHDPAVVTLHAGGDNIIDSQDGNGIEADHFGKVTLTTDTGYNRVSADDYALYIENHSMFSGNVYEGDIFQNLYDQYGIESITLTTPHDNVVTSTSGTAINAIGMGSISLNAGNDNVITGRNGIAVSANENDYDLYATVNLNAPHDNIIISRLESDSSGYTGRAISVSGKGILNLNTGHDNIIQGFYDGAEASNGGVITISAPNGVNYVTAGTEEGTALKARSGGQVTIDGESHVSGKNAILSTGSQTIDDEKQYSNVTLTYGKDNTLDGDIRAQEGGQVSIKPGNGSIAMNGNVYAYDDEVDNGVGGGEVNIKLNGQSRLTGFARDGRSQVTKYYADRLDNFDELFDQAWQEEEERYRGWGYSEEEIAAEKEYFYSQKEEHRAELEEEAQTALETYAGTLSLTLDDGAFWLMTDSSSVTNLSGSGGTVYYENGGDALEIGTLSGSHTFALDLDADDGSNSDMLYINNGTSDEQTLVVKNLETLDNQMDAGEAVRFATISNSQDEFRNGRTIGYLTSGIYRDALTIEYRDVTTDPLNTAAYNEAYNGDTTDGERKPTTETVSALYIDGYDDPQNVYLVKSQEVNDGAVTPGRNRDLLWRYVTDLDTFTKRDGQAQYFTDDGKRGGWVRLGYRNLGVDGVGELDGNTYELGWTTISRQNNERKHRFSASVAYGKPKGQFEGYGGELTVRDFSVNLYDTHEYYPSAEKLVNKPEWKKESHAYWDNYLKYHHVKTEYDAYDHIVGTKYSGDYDQDVWNLSTEYGHKLMLNKDWFWVPQAQLQLSYLGGYDYVDSQGLHVDGDHDWSLIGRLGFDVVRNLDEKADSKLYFKASLLHEFMDGNDVTTRFDSDRHVDSGDQEGTWGVVGLGYSSKIGDKQYFYLDAERYFGNDFTRTYDIRAGVNWKF